MHLSAPLWWALGSAAYLLAGCHYAASSYEAETGGCICGEDHPEAPQLAFPRGTALALMLAWPLWMAITVAEWVWWTVCTAANAVTEPR